MSILTTLFGGKPPVQQPQQQTPPANPHVASNPTIPNGNEPPANPQPGVQTAVSPTDKFKDLWSTTNQPTAEAPNFKLNPEQLAQVSATMDFTKSVSREDLAKIAQGGEAAIEAFGNVLNTMGREVFKTSAQFASHMTESGYQSASRVIDNGLPGAIKRQLTEQHIYQSNPQFNNPALQPMIGALQAQFTAKHPNATPQEINDLVSEYMTTVVTPAFVKPDPNAGAPKQPTAQDFSSFLNM